MAPTAGMSLNTPFVAISAGFGDTLHLCVEHHRHCLRWRRLHTPDSTFQRCRLCIWSDQSRSGAALWVHRGLVSRARLCDFHRNAVVWFCHLRRPFDCWDHGYPGPLDADRLPFQAGEPTGLRCDLAIGGVRRSNAESSLSIVTKTSELAGLSHALVGPPRRFSRPHLQWESTMS